MTNDKSPYMKEVVKEYYGSTLKSTNDLKTSACCDSTIIPDILKEPLRKIHPEILSHYYGCGLVAPCLLEGLRILDLGCGSGRDVYLLSQLVGRHGEVVGVDMTSKQLEIANQYIEYHSKEFGFKNFHFLKGDIEKLDELRLGRESFDLIVSNCVINLSPNKNVVFSSIKELLKTGGEFYFADIYSDRRIPDELKKDPLLYGECLSGSLYWNDFNCISRKEGFKDPRLVNDRALTITDNDLAKKIGDIKFYSATFRLFNISELEYECEDYGQAVIYKGTISSQRDEFFLDKHHRIEKNKISPVSGNTFRILSESRFAPHFDFIGDFSRHDGIFGDSALRIPFTCSSNIDTHNCC